MNQQRPSKTIKDITWPHGSTIISHTTLFLTYLCLILLYHDFIYNFALHFYNNQHLTPKTIGGITSSSPENNRRRHFIKPRKTIGGIITTSPRRQSEDIWVRPP
ncbi:hypothetical protein H5410_022617 [Solanum commersonii]|uniref:Transmembrane protein n=1 Tax=Solanum commersonii TaxID=4109 RepID=A0A9J5ZHQ7_SOLCO|nr:hypothetical protein H5410_022617 [Solanum commersonii]